MENGISSALRWKRMLKRPKLGMKKQTIEVILLREEKSPQSRMKNVEVKGTNCFSVFTVLR